MAQAYLLEIFWLFETNAKAYQPSHAQVFPTTGLAQMEQL
jgi:hypothetical protein